MLLAGLLVNQTTGQNNKTRALKLICWQRVVRSATAQPLFVTPRASHLGGSGGMIPQETLKNGSS